MLTSGEWEVVDAPTAVDLARGLVYLIATKESPTQRGFYRVKLDGSSFEPLTDTPKPGYTRSHFRKEPDTHYQGPSVPWQSIISTEGDKITTLRTIEDNADLGRMVEPWKSTPSRPRYTRISPSMSE
jgi:dipeptidyl aminopeptidase